jgi:hypothetical protein
MSEQMAKYKQHVQIDVSGPEQSIEHRLNDVERRLRSVEQPIWKIEKANEGSWTHCTEGTCRCQAVIKSVSCWRMRLKHIPTDQTIPNNIVQM